MPLHLFLFSFTYTRFWATFAFIWKSVCAAALIRADEQRKAKEVDKGRERETVYRGGKRVIVNRVGKGRLGRTVFCLCLFIGISVEIEWLLAECDIVHIGIRDIHNECCLQHLMDISTGNALLSIAWISAGFSNESRKYAIKLLYQVY